MSRQLYVVSASPGSLGSLRAELEQAGCEILESLEPFRLLVESPGARSLFCLHRFPVQVELLLDSIEIDAIRPCVWEPGLAIEALQEADFAIQLAANRRLEWSFAELVESLITDLALPRERFVPRRPEVVLSLYLHQDGQRCRVLAGVSTPAENLSPWTSGQCRIPRDPQAVSRAEAKLLEAWEAFGLPDAGSRGAGARGAAPRGEALDLGAAPGGWSRVLAQRGYRVDAVDPAALDPRVVALPAVTHHAETAGSFFAREPKLFDLFVCDMKMDAVMAAALLVRHADRLHREHGRLLTTLKLGKGVTALSQAKAALDRLESAYEILAARQLYFNRSEITVYARRKPR